MATTIFLKKSPTAGDVPIKDVDLATGEIAINLADRKIYVNNGATVERLDGAYVDSVAPTAGAVEGDLWYDTTNNMLKTYNGTSWVAAGYTTLSQFGITATAAELNHTDGVTSNIQTQLNGKAASGHDHDGTYEPADATILKDADIGTNVQGYSAVLQNTTASFTTADEAKLDGIEAGADVTDATNVAAAGALMKTGGTVTNTVNFNSADLKMDVGDVYMADGMKTYYGTSNDLVICHDGTTSYIHNSSASLEFESWQDFIFDLNGWEKFKIHGTGVNVTGDVAVTGTVDGRDVAADGTKLDGIEAGADVTDATNVAAAGALMDSECTNVGALKAINQQLTTTSDVDFNNLVLAGNLTVNGTTTSVNSNEVNIGDSIIVLNSDETGTPSQNAGFEVERGTSANVSFIWNETNDAWDMGGYELQNVTIDGGSY